VIDCADAGVVMPSTFQLACADDNDYFRNLGWTSWRRGYAAADGIQAINDCVPSCVAGTFRSYRVRVILWGDAAVTGHPGQRRYTMYTLRYPGLRPPAYRGTTQAPGPASVTGRLWDWAQRSS
jgi:hypothetical protein